MWEGGIRVPAIVRWPGRMPAGRVSRQVGMTMDLTASILAAAGVAAPPEAKLDGVNLLPILEGRAPEVERTLFWRVTARAAAAGGPQRTLEAGRRPGAPAPLRFSSDIGERTDVDPPAPSTSRRGCRRR